MFSYAHGEAAAGGHLELESGLGGDFLGSKGVTVMSRWCKRSYTEGTMISLRRHKEPTTKASNTIRFDNLNCTFGDFQTLFV